MINFPLNLSEFNKTTVREGFIRRSLKSSQVKFENDNFLLTILMALPFRHDQREVN